jgi:hypothetical protein
MFLTLARCPTTELDFPLEADPIPHRQDRLKPVMVHQPRNVSISLGLNYSAFPNSCLEGEFLIVVKRYKIIAYDFEDVGTVPELGQCNSQTLHEQHFAFGLAAERTGCAEGFFQS